MSVISILQICLEQTHFEDFFRAFQIELASFSKLLQLDPERKIL